MGFWKAAALNRLFRERLQPQQFYMARVNSEFATASQPRPCGTLIRRKITKRRRRFQIFRIRL